MKKCLMLCWLAFAALTVHGATVYWNVFESYYEDSSSWVGQELGRPLFGAHAYGPWGSPEITFSISRSMSTTTLSDAGWVMNMGAPEAVWIQAYSGMELTVDNTLNAETVFLNMSKGSPGQEVDISFSGPSAAYKTIFLGFCNGNTDWGGTGGNVWGWVELLIHGLDVSLVSSCLVTDADGIIVGTDTYLSHSTPEPSCALLLLVGVGVLSLRRR